MPMAPAARQHEWTSPNSPSARLRVGVARPCPAATISRNSELSMTRAKNRSGYRFLAGQIRRRKPHPVIDEGGKPAAGSVIVHRAVGNVFMTLFRTRQFHTMRAT